MSGNNDGSNQKKTVLISSKIIAAKLRGKREVFRFCASEVKMYVDNYDNMNVFHMRDQLAKKKQYILAADVKHANVPFYENLTQDTCLQWARNRPENVMDYLPDLERELSRLSR